MSDTFTRSDAGAFYHVQPQSAGADTVNLHQVPVISIVDDDESVREATKSLVRSLGYKAVAFCSAEEFLESPHVTATVCLITDVHMRGLSGVDLQDRLIADGRRMPVIFVTALPDEELRARVFKSGAVGYLPKPCNDDRFIECIDAALRVDSRSFVTA
jgi:FixJ family two-component response regulator